MKDKTKELLSKIVENGCKSHDDMGNVWCFFCGDTFPEDENYNVIEEHTPNCVYQEIKELINPARKEKKKDKNYASVPDKLFQPIYKDWLECPECERPIPKKGKCRHCDTKQCNSCKWEFLKCSECSYFSEHEPLTPKA